jgi:hypothetical protein
MSNASHIKNWIRESKSGKALHDASILIQKAGESETRITLLDHACCRPQIRIAKNLEDIEKEDIAAFEHVINHAH